MLSTLTSAGLSTNVADCNRTSGSYISHAPMGLSDKRASLNPLTVNGSLRMFKKTPPGDSRLHSRTNTNTAKPSAATAATAATSEPTSVHTSQLSTPITLGGL